MKEVMVMYGYFIDPDWLDAKFALMLYQNEGLVPRNKIILITAMSRNEKAFWVAAVLFLRLTSVN